jgi:DNA-binding GntR family transcriptional regulator
MLLRNGESGSRARMDAPGDGVDRRIAAAIGEGEFPPGTPLVEQSLAERFGVSRIPIREALRKLEGDGLVAYYPRRGHFVASVSAADIDEIFYLRENLELAAVRLAYQRIPPLRLQELDDLLDSLRPHESPREELLDADQRIHDLIAEHAGNSRLRHTLQQLNDQIQFTRSAATQLPGRFEDSTREHKAILEALRLGDLPLIEARLRVHLRAGCEATHRACSSLPALVHAGDRREPARSRRGPALEARPADATTLGGAA